MSQTSQKNTRPGLSESDLADWENFTEQINPPNKPDTRTSSASKRELHPSLTESDLADWENFTKQINPPNNQDTRTSPLEDETEFLKDEDLEDESVQPEIYHPRRSIRKTRERLAELEAKLLHKLKSKEIKIEAKLDLHGCTQVQARDKLLQFVRSSYSQQHKIVLVVTGKGEAGMNDFGMQEKGIIRQMLPKWLLNEEFHDYVVASSLAFRWDGGDGARYVQIRRKRR